jgi:type I restriction enzyme M protein
MNTDTKKHIDSARQVLVGVVPNPTSQIDQITNALIYKFMDDMDQAAIKQGDEPSFFVNDLEQYAWTRLMDPRMGNQERMNLYGEALVKFSQAKQLPELFRGIFKSAFLPYRSPETLGLFLKEIDYFDYSHPEELGNAYEYLLSIMSSQGDAGQFRTPRHIIDFIVDVVNPTKDDKVLDPACGTGGFLVSSYKHILKQHDGKDELGKKEKPLTPDERKKLMANFEGYDIDPTMARIAQVNMYLHQFKNPKIFQYDSLSSEERWNDKFDVILANPPFMSPKGGIKPHSKFSIPSSRSEVLFVDYIMTHLRPKGRAGIIVPDGIIFQSGTAHKQLRKNLINDGLYAVVSLPSGVFQPYSGVKTSILFFDNEFAIKRAEILFVEIKNTGIGLTTTQRVVEENDIPFATKALKEFQNCEPIKANKVAFIASKQEIIELDYDLMSNKYRKQISENPEAPLIALSEVCKITKGKSSSTKTNPGKYPLVLMASDFKTSDHFDFEGEGVCVPLMTAASTGVAAMKRVHYINGKFALANLLAFVEPNDKAKLNPIYLYKVLLFAVDDLARLMKGAANVSMKTSDLETFKIPLPPIDIQNKIAEIFETERKLAESSRKQMDSYELETKGIIEKLWAE